MIFPTEYLSHSSSWPNFVCWQLVSGDGAHTDAGSVAGSLEAAPPLERTGGIGESRPTSYQSVPAGKIVSRFSTEHCVFFRSCFKTLKTVQVVPKNQKIFPLLIFWINHLWTELAVNWSLIGLSCLWSGKAASGRDSLDNDTETGSMVSQRRERERPRRKHSHDHGQKNTSWTSFNNLPDCYLIFLNFFFYLSVGGRQNGYSASRALGRGAADYDSCSSFMSSELESTSCFDSEDDDATSRSDVLSGSSAFFFFQSLSLVARMHQEWALAEILQIQMFWWFWWLPHVLQESISAFVKSQVVFSCTLPLYQAYSELCRSRRCQL